MAFGEAVLNAIKCLQRAFRSSVKTPDPQHTLLQTRDAMSAKDQDSCGFQGARAAKSDTGSLVRETLAGGVDVRVLEEGWERPL